MTFAERTFLFCSEYQVPPFRTFSGIRAVFDAISLRPRMLIDVARVDTSTMVLGHILQHPIMIDTAGVYGRSHPEAELATARAAGAEYGLFRS